MTPDGRFAFGFGHDQTRASLVTVRYPEGGGDSRSFTLQPLSIQTQTGLDLAAGVSSMSLRPGA